jgi:hypothetical protein
MDSFIHGTKQSFNSSHINANEELELNEICEICNYVCYSKRFQQNFKNWTSGNYNIDKFIQDTQLSAHRDVKKALEWVPYEKFYDIKYIAGGKYRANWIDGNMIFWDNKNQNWIRKGQNISVGLKRLNNLKNITFEFMDKV